VTCCVESTHYPFGSKEPLRAHLEANFDLDAQPVFFSIDGGAWIPGTWDGPVGPERDAFVDDVIETLYRGKHSVRAKIVDASVEPIIDLGHIWID
jgi:hypothetical protein